MKNQEQGWLLLEKYQGMESESFHADCARLAAGEPLGYVIGFVPFLDCVIHLDSRPLIPRPETEYWTEQAISAIKQAELALSTTCQAIPLREPVQLAAKPIIKILDLCAGSGAIGLAVAKAIPEVRVTFAEIDPSHLPTIKKNIELNLLVNRYTKVIQSDLFENTEGTFDFILTNPPYIDETANTVDKNVVDHEPHLALFGGVAGMEIIERIIAGARAKLAHQESELWIEHEPFQTEAIKTLAKQYQFNAVTHPDQYGIPRVSVLTMAQ